MFYNNKCRHYQETNMRKGGEGGVQRNELVIVMKAIWITVIYVDITKWEETQPVSCAGTRLEIIYGNLNRLPCL